SIGLQRWQLAISVWFEVILLGLLGALAGILTSIPIVYYFMVNPIRFSGEMASSMEKFGFEPVFPATFDPQIFVTQAVYVFFMTAVLAIYPMFKIRKLQPVQAMRG
ncbi:MAG: FtsX-like permease family protein, partial [Phaeodactylibacter sp.]|nr:FtsX-like permease family protein [Phaeodactylibacter sp.]